MKKKILLSLFGLSGLFLISCSNNNSSIGQQTEPSEKTSEIIQFETESVVSTEENTNEEIVNTEKNTEVEKPVRLGSRTNAMKIGDITNIRYTNWNNNTHGEFSVSVISSENGKTSVNITLNSETRNNPINLGGEQYDHSTFFSIPPIQFYETDNPMSFIYENSYNDAITADKEKNIGVGSSETLIYNTNKPYLVIVTWVLAEIDTDTTYDIFDGEFNTYYTFIKLY